MSRYIRLGSCSSNRFVQCNDCLPHDLFIAKLTAYGLDVASLRLMYSRINSRFQRVNIGSHGSTVKKITIGVPQGLVLGPLLLNIFISDVCLFNLDSEMCNFADDNTLYSC